MVKTVEFWQDEFNQASTTARAWLVPSSAVNPTDSDPSDILVPFCFDFESLSVAVPVVMCWSVATQLYSNVIQVHDLLQARLGCHIELEYLLTQADTDVITLKEDGNQDSPSSTTNENRSFRDVQSTGTRMARKIYQSMEYFHRTDMGTYGGQYVFQSPLLSPWQGLGSVLLHDPVAGNPARHLL
jgi:hypothetical protein